MKSLIIVAAVTFFSCVSKAQSKPEDRKIDSLIQIELEPELVEGVTNKTAPNWMILKQAISSRYNQTVADRNINKAQIYYFYEVHKSKFASALVRFTEKYEDKNNAKLMNKNAKMILESTDNKKELQAAQDWIKNAVAKDPKNELYKETQNKLTEKIASIS